MSAERLNVVAVVCHDLGRRLGCYGVADVRSYHIDAFARGGVRFANSFCVAPQCSPSRAALWTGRFPHANGVVGLTHADFHNDLHPGERHFAQILADAGYETHLFGLQHEASSAQRCGYGHRHSGKLAHEVADSFVTFIDVAWERDRPFFAHVGFEEPHRPFPHAGIATLNPARLRVPPYLPDIPVVRQDLAAMEASTAAADRAFGRIVEAIHAADLAANTLILFTVDHGIPFPRAKMTLYDPGIETALIVQAPGLERGVVYRQMVSHVDVMPTLLELLGLPLPPNLHGRSFKGLLDGAGYTANEVVFAEKTYHTYYDPMRAVRTPRWKLIANFEFAPWQEVSPDYDNNARGYVEVARALDVPYSRQYHPPFELYDLREDPWEQHNLADEAAHRATRDELIRRLRRWMEETADPLLDGPIAQGAYRRRMAAFKDISAL